MFLGSSSTVRFRRLVADVYHTCTECVAQEPPHVVFSRLSLSGGEAGSKSVRFAVIYRLAAAIVPTVREAFWLTRILTCVMCPNAPFVIFPLARVFS